jgi:outer membrane protein assembly factor BamB
MAYLKVMLAFLFASSLWCASLEWPQFGGPNRNFQASATGLAASWPSGGPKKLWSRDLGEGYSSVVVDGNVLYTMFRRGNQEVVLAADASTGKTLWERAADAAFLPHLKMENGPGPHATPLVTADALFVVGILAKLEALDKRTGKTLWSHDLYREFGGKAPDRGYACSPIAYQDRVIVQIGGTGSAVAAFRQKDGVLAWKKQNFDQSPSSPVVIRVGGQDQLVAFMAGEVAGLDPKTGDLLWSHPHQTSWGLNIALPVWGADGVLLISSAYSGGTRALQLTQASGRTEVKQLWFTNRMRVHHGNLVRIGDVVYGSSGDFGPAPLTAIEVKTGKILWQDRAFPKANIVCADGKAIVLDEDGNLALAQLSPQGLKVISKAAVLRSNAWTPPTLAGTRLFIRDRRGMAAFDLK